MQKECKKKTIVSILLFGGIFAFLLAFFSQAHPLLPFDMDDWSYLSYRRNAYPLWRDWNPSRVFPETFMALISDIGVFALTPLFGLDYLHGQILAHAITVSVIITVYVFLFRRYLRNRWKTGEGVSLLLTLLFLLLHFSIFRRERTANEHLFWTFNLTGYYFYVLPNLINASLVLLLLGTSEEERAQASFVKKGLLALVIYLAILSNLFPTAILMVYLGAELVGGSLKMKKEGKRVLKNWLTAQGWRLAAIALWFVSLIFEANGGRAGSAGGFDPGGAVMRFAAWGKRLNLQTTALFLLILLIGVILWVRERKRIGLSSKGAAITIWFGVAAMLCAVFEIVLCAKVDVEKLELSRVIFSVFFYVFLMILTILERILKTFPKAVIAVPLITYVLLINTRIGDRTFLDSNGTNLSGKTAIEVTQFILDQAVAADTAGMTEAELHVPNQLQEDNWPHVYGMGSALSQTLYRHGIVSRRIDFTVIADPMVNERFSLEETDVDLSRGIRYNTLR